MYVKQFRGFAVPVPDPLRPGRVAYTERLVPTGATSLSLGDEVYRADERDGWFDVPHEMGLRLLALRYPGGERWHSPEQVNEEVRRGSFEDPKDSAPPADKAVPRARRTSAQAD